jgi:hypothetical protein
LHQDIEHVSGLIHSPPQIMALAFDSQKHLVSGSTATRRG